MGSAQSTVAYSIEALEIGSTSCDTHQLLDTGLVSFKCGGGRDIIRSDASGCGRFGSSGFSGRHIGIGIGGADVLCLWSIRKDNGVLAEAR
jgi:hypothetical protein